MENLLYNTRKEKALRRQSQGRQFVNDFASQFTVSFSLVVFISQKVGVVYTYLKNIYKTSEKVQKSARVP